MPSVHNRIGSESTKFNFLCSNYSSITPYSTCSTHVSFCVWNSKSPGFWILHLSLIGPISMLHCWTASRDQSKRFGRAVYFLEPSKVFNEVTKNQVPAQRKCQWDNDKRSRFTSTPHSQMFVFVWKVYVCFWVCIGFALHLPCVCRRAFVFELVGYLCLLFFFFSFKLLFVFV